MRSGFAVPIAVTAELLKRLGFPPLAAQRLVADFEYALYALGPWNPYR